MSLVYAAITPHGLSIIEEISGNESNLFKQTRTAMETMGRNIINHKPDTIILLSPHGLRLKGYNAIYLSEYCRGSLSQYGRTVSVSYKCDKELANKILHEVTKSDIPIVGCNYGALTGEESNIEMDWGTLIPLWFCQDLNYKPELVVITPTRDIELNKLVQLGEIIAKVSYKDSKKIALVASADQGHCHDKNGPYGYNKASIIYDNLVNDIIKNNNLERLLNISMDLVNKAKPDSLWQLLILHGSLKLTPMKTTFLSYQVPTYFGMTVVGYEK